MPSRRSSVASRGARGARVNDDVDAQPYYDPEDVALDAAQAGDELARLLDALRHGDHGDEGVEVAGLIEAEGLDYATATRLSLRDLAKIGIVRFGRRIRAMNAIKQCVAMNNPNETPALAQLPRAVLSLVNAERMTGPAGAKASQLLLRQRATTPPKLPIITVPVFQAIMVKKFREIGEDEGINMVGTIIQRVLFYDIAQIKRVNRHLPLPHFEFRFNEGTVTDHSACVLRTTRVTAIDCELEPGAAAPGATQQHHSFPCLASTFSVDLPMVQYSVYEASRAARARARATRPRRTG